MTSGMKLGIIGAGKMATAMCRGFISAGLVKPHDVLASDVNANKLEDMKTLGVETTTCNKEVVQKKSVIYLAVKPYIVADVLDVVSSLSDADKLFVSVAAGITTTTMEKHLPTGSRVVRVMPNTPALVQCAASVFTRGKHARQEDADLVANMLGSVGIVEEMPEENMDAVTGLSGNGPSYGYLLINSLADGGVKMGLNRNQSIRLAAQTMMGAARMILETGIHPEQLKDEVCSPGGTSAHAIHMMEKAGFRGGLVDAVEAGTLRSIEIGKKYNSS